MRILIVEDGRPGHIHLSEGLAAAIGRFGEIEVSRLRVRLGTWSGSAASKLTRLPISSKRLLRTVYGLDAKGIPNVDLVVSAGAETLAANIWIARLARAPNVFYGSLRRYRPEDFALVLTSYKRSITRPNIVRTLKPSGFDPDAIPRFPKRAVPLRLGLLIGGPTTDAQFREEDWTRLSQLVLSTHRKFQIRWVISNSRRTPSAVTEKFRALAAASQDAVEEWIDVNDPGAPRLLHLFIQVEGVVCTADSSSMISEAIWARRPLVSVEPHLLRLPPEEAEYRTWMRDNGWCHNRPLTALTPDALLGDLINVEPLRENPLDALAELLRDRIGLSL